MVEGGRQTILAPSQSILSRYMCFSLYLFLSLGRFATFSLSSFFYLPIFAFFSAFFRSLLLLTSGDLARVRRPAIRPRNFSSLGFASRVCIRTAAPLHLSHRGASNCFIRLLVSRYTTLISNNLRRDEAASSFGYVEQE